MELYVDEQIQFEFNETGGYLWFVETENDCVQVSEYYSNEKKKFDITTLKKGSCIITFTYKRPWNNNVAKTHTIKVEINE